MTVAVVAVIVIVMDLVVTWLPHSYFIIKITCSLTRHDIFIVNFIVKHLFFLLHVVILCRDWFVEL